MGVCIVLEMRVVLRCGLESQATLCYAKYAMLWLWCVESVFSIALPSSLISISPSPRLPPPQDTAIIKTITFIFHLPSPLRSHHIISSTPSPSPSLSPSSPSPSPSPSPSSPSPYRSAAVNPARPPSTDYRARAPGY